MALAARAVAAGAVLSESPCLSAVGPAAEPLLACVSFCIPGMREFLRAAGNRAAGSSAARNTGSGDTVLTGLPMLAGGTSKVGIVLQLGCWCYPQDHPGMPW